MNLDAFRAHLKKLARAAGVDPGHVDAQTDADLTECKGLSNATLTDWLRLRGSCPVCAEVVP